MDGLSIAASIVGIATAGVQVSIKLVTLATQISTASDRVSAIGNDISLTSSVLRQLGDLMTQNITDRGISILNLDGLESTKTAAAMCERIFLEIEKEVEKASEQLRRHKPRLGKMRAQKIELSTTEKAKWPLLQPRIDGLRADLRDAKSTLILLLQVATLALNKRMADASVPSSKYQDLIRAVVALELDRREERAHVTAQQEVSRSPSSNDAPDVGSSNKFPPRETLLKLYQNPTFASRTEIGPTYDPETTISHQDLPGKRKRDSLDANASPGAGRPKGWRPAGIMENPLETFPGRNPTVDAVIDPPHSSLTSGTPNSSELKLFLLKPIVRDLFDRIELRWTVQDTYMRSRAIRDYMNKDEKDVNPSVVEMLQQLHAYEHEMLDAQMPKCSGRSILSLKRKTIDIRSRDMLFNAVPGLEFVVQCHVDKSPSQLYVQESPPQPQQISFGPPMYQRPLSPSLSIPLSKTPISEANMAPTAEVKPSLKIQQRVGMRRRRRSLKLSSRKNLPSEVEDKSVDDTGVHAHSQLSVLDRDEDSLDEEAEAEAMVNGLLKQYTTLFDS